MVKTTPPYPGPRLEVDDPDFEVEARLLLNINRALSNWNRHREAAARDNTWHQGKPMYGQCAKCTHTADRVREASADLKVFRAFRN